jgi:hypothetical protein
LGVSTKVLGTIGRLASEAGDATTARKAAAVSQSLSGPENVWLVAAVKMLIRRSGEVTADPAQAGMVITMADLPM